MGYYYYYYYYLVSASQSLVKSDPHIRNFITENGIGMKPGIKAKHGKKRI